MCFIGFTRDRLRNGAKASSSSPCPKINTDGVQNKLWKKNVSIVCQEQIWSKKNIYCMQRFLPSKSPQDHFWGYYFNCKDAQKFLIGTVSFSYLQQATYEHGKAQCCPWHWVLPCVARSNSHYLDMLLCASQHTQGQRLADECGRNLWECSIILLSEVLRMR